MMVASIVVCAFLTVAITGLGVAATAATPAAIVELAQVTAVAAGAGASVQASGSSIANCAWGAYDLSPLALGDKTWDAPGSTTSYTISMCGKVTESGCAAQNGAACMYTQPPAAKPKMLAVWDGSGVWSQLNAADPSKGVQVVFKTGASCSGGVLAPLQLTVQVTCVLGGGDTSYLIAPDINNNCRYTLRFNHNAGCPNGGSPPDGGDGGGSSGLSNGSIFTIIFFVVGFVYVLGGCIYKRQRMGTVGMAESCPNIDIWRQVPGLVSDGCKFTWAKLRGLCGGAGGGGSSSSGSDQTGVAGAPTETYGSLK